MRLFATILRVTANIQCKAVNSLPVICVSAGIYTMVIVSIERVRCVLPTKGHAVVMPGRSIGIRGTMIALAFVWVLSVVLAVPNAVNFEVGVVDDPHSSNHSLVVCHSTWNSLQTSVYSMFLLAASYVVPMAILYVNYGRLAAYLWKRSRVVTPISTGSQTTTPGGGSATTPTAVRSIKMLATVAILFLAAWAPYFTIMTIEVCSFCSAAPGGPSVTNSFSSCY